MGSEPRTAEELAETRGEIQQLKLGIYREVLKVVYVFAAALSMNLVPLLLLGATIGFELVLATPPTVTLEPPAVHLSGGQGAVVTKLIKGFVVIDIIRNLVKLYWKGTPEIELEADIPETNND